ncbi:hypothetical protein J6590_040136 [Homalodisca vitripennis]|nr:hypothetical protein J6590_040136 [Homalodisca vitripennis]
MVNMASRIFLLPSSDTKPMSDAISSTCKAVPHSQNSHKPVLNLLKSPDVANLKERPHNRRKL